MDSTAGPNAPILTEPDILCGVWQYLVENQQPPAERPKCATTRVSVDDKNSQIDSGSSLPEGVRGWDRTAGFVILIKKGFLF